MRNLYQRSVMRPASKAAIGGRLLGASGRTSGVAPVVTRANPDSFFTNPIGRRGMVAPSTMSPYPLGASGGLAGLGALDATYGLGIGNIGFAEEWSFADWKGNNGWTAHIAYWKLGTYEGLSDTVIKRANQKWNELKAAADMGNVAAEEMLEQYKNTISAAADAVDKNTPLHSLGRRSDAVHKERIRLLNALNSAIRAFANAPTPSMPMQSQPQSNVNQNMGAQTGTNIGTGSAGGFNPGLTVGGSTTPGALLSTGGAQTGLNLPPPAAKKRSMVPLLAAGALVALGAGVYLMRRKK